MVAKPAIEPDQGDETATAAPGTRLDPDQPAPRFVVRLTSLADGRLRVAADGPAGRAEATSPAPAIDRSANGDDEGQWLATRRTGFALYRAAFPPPIARLLTESLAARRDTDDPLSLVLELADSGLAALPWEVLRDPAADRPLVLSPDVRFSRARTDDVTGHAHALAMPSVQFSQERPWTGRWVPSSGPLRVLTLSRAAMATLRSTAANLTLLGRDTAADGGAPHLLYLDEAVAPEERTTLPAAPVIVIDEGRVAPAQVETTGDASTVVLPATMSDEARASFVASLGRELADGHAVDAATAIARADLARDLGLQEMSWAAPRLIAGVHTGPLVVGPRLSLTTTTHKVKSETVGWLKDTLSGVVSSVVLFVAGLLLFRLGFSGSSSFSLELLSPDELYQTFKALVVALSSFQEHLLLIASGALSVITIGFGLLWWREHRRSTPAAHPIARLTARYGTRRSLVFWTMATLTVLGAYAYQQYLWNVLLPIPSDAIGFAITREAAAASVQSELSDALFSQGAGERVVVRELPVNFDASDTVKARELGQRIGAKAVLIYRAERDANDRTSYVAYVVFSDPTYGFSVGGAPPEEAVPEPAANLAAGLEAAQPPPTETGDYAASLGIPALRTDTVTELIDASAGIIAYQEGRFREAIEHLERAVPAEPAAPNSGIINYFLGAAYEFDDQDSIAVEALQRAVTHYESRRALGAKLAPQDELLLARSYHLLAKIAVFEDDFLQGIAWGERANDIRDDLLDSADQLDRPEDARITLARIYGQIAVANRFLERPDEVERWTVAARAEIDAFAAEIDPRDSVAIAGEASARFFIGDCAPALASYARGLALSPSDADLHLDYGIVSVNRARHDVALDHWHQALALRPDDTLARLQIANLTWQDVISYHDPAAYETLRRTYDEVLALDPINLQAHRNLAELAWWQASSSRYDLPALNKDDLVSYRKSDIAWERDPVRRQEALRAYDALVQQRRLLATELRPNDVAAWTDLASAYHERQEFVFWGLPDAEIAGDIARMRDDGNLALADINLTLTWTDRILASDSGADRLQRLQAWNMAVDTLANLYAWYAYPTFGQRIASVVVDRPMAVALEQVAQTWLAQTRLAIEEIGGAEPASPAEGLAMYGIYGTAWLAESFLANDEALANQYRAKMLEVGAKQLDDRVEDLAISRSFCNADRELQQGKSLLEEGDTAGARGHYDAALALDPTNITVLIAYADLLAHENDAAGAVEIALAATEAAPNLPVGWERLARYRLLAGDDAGREAAYDRFLALTAELPQRRGLAEIVAAVDGLQTIAGDPEQRQRVLTVMPRFSAALEAMPDDAARWYEYAGLYAKLGAIALNADDAATAEPLLRRAVELDPLQPIAHAQLWLSIVARGGDGADALATATEAAMDETWTDMTDIAATPDDWIAKMEDEVAQYGERFPARAEAVSAFSGAFASARERWEQRAAGVEGTTFTSPEFGYTLGWDATWSVGSVTADETGEILRLDNGTASIIVETAPSYANNLAGCLDENKAYFTGLEGFDDFAVAGDERGNLIEGLDDERAFIAYTMTGPLDDGTTGQIALYFECRDPSPETAGILVVYYAEIADFNDQAANAEAILASLLGPSGIPVPFGPIPRLPEPNIPLVGVTGQSYASPVFGYRLTWAAPWTVEQATSADDVDQLDLTNGTSDLSVIGYAETGKTPVECLQTELQSLSENETITNLAILTDTEGNSRQGRDQFGIYGVFGFSRDSGDGSPSDEVVYIGCRPAGSDGAFIVALHVAPSARYDAEASTRDEVLGTLELGGERATTESNPVSRPLPAPPRLPAKVSDE